MSVSYIPERIKVRLWGKAGGRCQYDGCNIPLWHDELTKCEFNTSYIAHIIADQPNGPRGDEELSKLLKDDISNLMLLCDAHHRLVDREQVELHDVERLRTMKKKHETRIEKVTSISDNMQSFVLLYGSNVGEHHSIVSYEKTVTAMTPRKYPAEKTAIELGLKNSSFYDNEELFWLLERQQLNRQFNDKIKVRIIQGEVYHLSVFALAPQPLLIELGRLISDLCPTEVYQLHREPTTWSWQEEEELNFEYTLIAPENCYKTVALNLSLSADIDDERIYRILGEETSIWKIKIEYPQNDFLKTPKQLEALRQTYRQAMNEIKKKHGQDNLLHVFPATPVAAAVELGRIWMPKADLPLKIYDQNRKLGGFISTFNIESI